MLLLLFKGLHGAVVFGAQLSFEDEIGSHDCSCEVFEDPTACLSGALFSHHWFSLWLTSLLKAYNMYTDGGAIGDAFMEDIAPVASAIPFMVAPGNHESYYNFSHFKHRFSMPEQKKTENLWWSVDIGMVHIVSYNTEAYFDGCSTPSLADWVCSRLLLDLRLLLACSHHTV